MLALCIILPKCSFNVTIIKEGKKIEGMKLETDKTMRIPETWFEDLIHFEFGIKEQVMNIIFFFC